MGRTSKTNLDTEKLRAWMQHRKLTAAQLSRKIGASANYMSNVLNGNARMSVTAYKALCAAFEVPEDTFTLPETPEQPQTFTATLESVPDSEIMERLDRIEHKLDKLLGIWGSTS